MKRRISSSGAFLVIVALLVLAAVGYSLSFGTLAPADYTFVNATEIKTIDPAIATGVPEHRILSAIFEGMTEWEPKNLEPVPGVAESWEISEDKKTYTFRIRNDAKWTDGTPVTAHDFIYSWRRFLHPATAAEYSYEMWYVVNAERFNKRQFQVGDEVEIELPKTSDNGDADTLPFAPGKIVKGKLLAVQAPANDSAGSALADEPQKDQETSDSAVYLLEIKGQERRFHKGGKDGEDYAWMLLDFDAVGVRALDERTLEVKLRHPVPYFLTLCGFYPYSPVNRTCVETFGREWTKPENIVTNGAYRLETRRLRDRIRMVKSDTYWDRDNVRLSIVDAVAVESNTTALNLYLTGQVDWIEWVPNPVVPGLLAQNRSDFQPWPYNTTEFYRLNVTKPPLDDVRVRRALNMATNKQDIVNSILKAGQEPARSMVPTVTATRSNYKRSLCEEYNVERARELLAEAGYPEGRGFPKFELQYNTNDRHSAVAELVQSQWQQALGIQIDLKGLEWNVYQTNQTNKTYDISRAGWVGDYPDPITFLKLWLSTSGQNQTGWGNDQYDALITKAQQERDDDRRAEFFHQAEALLMRELPIIPLYFYVSTSMSKPYVKGYYHNHQDFHPIKCLWIDSEAKARRQKEASL